MSYDIETAHSYRSHAGKLRSLAAAYEDEDEEEMAEILVGVARDYERMAEVHEETDGKNIVRLRAS
jgi:hypothetical protein